MSHGITVVRIVAVLAILASAGISYAQATGGGGVPGGNGSSNNGSTQISSLSFSPSDTTVVATWNTSTPTNSQLYCGGKSAVDNNIQQNATFHQAIVTGLTASAAYSCTVTSGVTSSTQTVTTNAAQTRTGISTVEIGSPTTTTVHGDTIYNCVSNDNVTYNTMDDGYGWTTPNAGANMQVDKLTTESTLAGTYVNLLTNYGAFATANGTDGPGGAALSNKLSGLFCMGGNLYGFQSRIYNASGGNPTIVQTEYAGNVIKSTDHGATWNTWQNPPAVSPNGIPPNPLGSFMWATTAYAWCEPVRYAIDDGTNGYLTTGNRIDGADGFVYVTCTDGHWNNGSNLYEMRVPRAQLSQQNGATYQYWHGPSSPAATDFVNDANWTSSATGATAIYSASGEVSAQDLTFIPAFNEYLLLTWYNPGGSPVSSSSTWNVLSGPTPAGPWTSLATPSYNPQGYYNPVVQHRTAATNTVTANAPLQIIFGGDYGSGSATYYYPTYTTLTLNPTPATVYVNTVFNEEASGNLAGTTPATCSNGCTGPWTLSSGTDWQYQGGGGIQTSTVNTAYDIIHTGQTNYTLRFTLANNGSGDLLQFALRYTNSSNFIAVNICPTNIGGTCSPGVTVYDVVGGTGTQIAYASGSTAGQFTIVLNGTSVSVTSPGGSSSGTTTNTSGTNVQFGLNTGTAAFGITALSVKSY